MDSEAERYQLAWRTMRWRRFLALFAWAGFPVLFIVVPNGVLLLRTGHGLPDAIATPLGIGWLALFAVSAVRVTVWPCPRCTRPFFMDGLVRVPFAKACPHCGLPRNASPSDASSGAGTK